MSHAHTPKNLLICSYSSNLSIIFDDQEKFGPIVLKLCSPIVWKLKHRIAAVSYHWFIHGAACLLDSADWPTNLLTVTCLIFFTEYYSIYGGFDDLFL